LAKKKRAQQALNQSVDPVSTGDFERKARDERMELEGGIMLKQNLAKKKKKMAKQVARESKAKGIEPVSREDDDWKTHCLELIGEESPQISAMDPAGPRPAVQTKKCNAVNKSKQPDPVSKRKRAKEESTTEGQAVDGAVTERPSWMGSCVDEAEAPTVPDAMIVDWFDKDDEAGDKDDRTVYVGGLPEDQANEYSLNAIFAECGKVRSVRIVRDKATGKPKGTVFLEFTSKASVSLALKLSGKLLEAKNAAGQPIKMEMRVDRHELLSEHGC